MWYRLIYINKKIRRSIYRKACNINIIIFSRIQHSEEEYEHKILVFLPPQIV